jgi:CHAD domain-containing protein
MKDWHATLAQSLRRHWKRHRNALKRCQKQFSEKTVHQSRIESRRLLAQFELLRIFVPAALFAPARRALERHRQTFDPLRDTQVQLLVLSHQARAFPKTKLLREALFRREKRCRKEAARRIAKVENRKLKKVVAAMLRRLEMARRNPARQVRERKAILHAVESAFSHVLECRAKMDPGHVATIHRTRVAFKKFRYMVEALQPLFPAITSARLRAMHSFQAVLGELQDTDVFLARVDKFIRKDTTRAAPLASFRHWLLRRRTAQIQHCLESADVIDKFWPLPERIARS